MCDYEYQAGTCIIAPPNISWGCSGKSDGDGVESAASHKDYYVAYLRYVDAVERWLRVREYPDYRAQAVGRLALPSAACGVGSSRDGGFERIAGTIDVGGDCSGGDESTCANGNGCRHLSAGRGVSANTEFYAGDNRCQGQLDSLAEKDTCDVGEGVAGPSGVDGQSVGGTGVGQRGGGYVIPQRRERGRHAARNARKRQLRKEKKAEQQGYVGGTSFFSGCKKEDVDALRASRITRLKAENELREAKAERNLRLLRDQDFEQVKKRQSVQLLRDTEVGRVQIENAYKGIVPGRVETIVSSSSPSSLSSPGLSSGTISPNSSISEAEVRKLHKDNLDLTAEVEGLRKELSELRNGDYDLPLSQNMDQDGFSYHPSLEKTQSEQDYCDKICEGYMKGDLSNIAEPPRFQQFVSMKRDYYL